MRKVLAGLLLTLIILPMSGLAQGDSNYQTPGSGVISTPGSSTMNAEDRKVYNYIQDVRQTVQQLTKRQEYKKAKEYFSRMNAMLDNSKMTSNVRNELVASIHRNELVDLHIARGNFDEAKRALDVAVQHKSSAADKKVYKKIQRAKKSANTGSGNSSGSERPIQANPGFDNPTGLPNPNPATPFPNRYDRRVMNYINDVRQTVQKLTREKKFKQAQKYFGKMNAMLDNNKMSDYYRKKLTASIHRNELAGIYSHQAEYQNAANAIRTAIKFDKNEKDMEKLLKTQEKVGLQRELFKMRKQHQKNMYRLQKQKSAYLNQKLAILRQYNTSKGLTDVDLKNIQKEFKAINAKLGQVNKNIRATQSRYQRSFQRIWKQGVFLTKEQKTEVYKLAGARRKLQADNYRKIRNITKKLSEISQNTQITWEGLKDSFKDLMTLQDKMYSIRKDLHGISQNVPLSAEQYAAAKKLRAELEKAMKKAAELMQGVEKAFVDTKTFAKLTFKEKLEFVRMFANVWKQDKEFNSMKPSLDDIYSKIFDNPIIIIDDPTPLPKPVPEPPMPKPEPGRQKIEGRGLIVLKGNNWYLGWFDNERLYHPLNLPARYKIDKLEVKFAGYLKYMRTSSGYKVPEPFDNWRESDNGAITFTYISAPQLPDRPYDNYGGQTATASEVIEENIDNQDQPSNLMNAF